MEREDKTTYRSYLLYTLEMNLEKAIQSNRAAMLVKGGKEVEYNDLLVKDDAITLFQEENEVANIDLNKVYFVKWFGNKVKLV